MATIERVGWSTTSGTATGRWVVTMVATVVAAGALDATATVVGLAVAASDVLAAASPVAVVVVLITSYGAWVVGLAGNVRANGHLLDDVGVSTNALSKLAHDVVAARSPSARRFAAAGGYVGTELLKELPYVTGALGVAAASGGIDRRDAAAFLVGANLGAAAYELCLAMTTRVYLRRRASS